MSSETIKTFKIIKVPAKKAYRKVVPSMDESSEPKKARHCAAAEMPAITMGIPKKKYSRECPVTAPSFSEIRLPLTKPEYDTTGKNIGLFIPQHSDAKVGTLIMTLVSTCFGNHAYTLKNLKEFSRSQGLQTP